MNYYIHIRNYEQLFQTNTLIFLNSTCLSTMPYATFTPGLEMRVQATDLNEKAT